MRQHRHGHVRLRLGLYALDALPPDEHHQVDEHLEVCPTCLSEYAELKEVVLALAALSKEEVRAWFADIDEQDESAVS